MRLIDADELKKQAYKSGDWDKPLVVDVADIEDAPTVDQWHYPSKGEYPPKEQEYFVAFKTDKEIYYDVRVLNPDLNNLLLGIGEQIYAWQYIIPPKEET